MGPYSHGAVRQADPLEVGGEQAGCITPRPGQPRPRSCKDGVFEGEIVSTPLTLKFTPLPRLTPRELDCVSGWFQDAVLATLGVV